MERGNKLTKSMSAAVSRNTSPSPSPSPITQNRRVAKLNLYLQRSAKISTEQLHRGADASSVSPKSTFVKRWDGNRRMTLKWDSLRRDPELWLPNGDCLVHFNERGQSRRGPSLRLSLAEIESSDCRPLLHLCYAKFVPGTPPASSSDSDKFSDTSDEFKFGSAHPEHELYIPAPTHLSREEAFQYHLTTRNFFAWMYGKPLVGGRLGDAMLALFGRMQEFRSSDEDDNRYDMLEYIDSQGYTDFRECPDHALATLQFAERLQDRHLWTDAFVHCAGMWEQLDESAEFEHVSRTSQALISRAHLEMDLRLERAGASLGNFLENDLSGALGLGKEAQLHLERFRSFLHTFYVGQHGYWPPTPLDRSSSGLPKEVYRSMYFDFRDLYDYLCDPTSETPVQDNKPVDGGICVYQNVVAFDQKHKYTSLPHPLPLIPKISASMNNRSTFGRLFGGKRVDMERRLAASNALCAASNPYDDSVMDCGLVRAYLRFEKNWTMLEQSTVSCADARKVRWILVYATLQILISVTRAPQEVRDTEGVSYPLCCQIGGTPPWKTGDKKSTRPTLAPIKTASLRERLLELGPDMDILSAKPAPLVVPQKSSRRLSWTPSPPRKLAVIHNITLKSPKPIRTASWEILNQKFGEVSPIDYNISPIENGDVSPIQQIGSHQSNPTTPSTSENGSGRDGWSASSSDDEMDHHSVNGSDSNYGDDEDEELRATGKSSKTPSMKRVSFGSFRPGSCNPEVDQYIRS
ncbi:MAG: hypothetical protein ASARMPREDX12_007352 [Alectoria sarmentosa]|nr:MAG: hypothetical protein ASARMPREDX12_007352 [Alectoria sarmentosa]